MTLRGQVRQYIIANPGCTTAEIKKAVDCHTSSVSTALFAFHKEGKVQRVTDVGMVKNARYYDSTGREPTPVESAIPDSIKRLLAPEPEAPIRPSQQSSPPIMLDLNTLAQQVAESLADAIIARISAIVRERFQTKLTSELTRTVATIHLPEEETTKTKKRKVLVVGLLPQQAGMIQQEYHEAFDLEFFKEGQMQQLRTFVKNADDTVVMIGFVSHGMSNVVKDEDPQYIPVNGGMSDLRRTLTALHVKD